MNLVLRRIFLDDLNIGQPLDSKNQLRIYQTSAEEFDFGRELWPYGAHVEGEPNGVSPIITSSVIRQSAPYLWIEAPASAGCRVMSGWS
jgi:hypothetical protein